MLEHIHWIPLLPLISAVVIFFFGRRLPGKGAPLGIAAMAAAAFMSWTTFLQAAAGKLALPYENSVDWFRFGSYGMDLGVYVDGLTLTMLIVVTTVSLLVQVYSTSYMHDDPRYKRYYAYLSMFTFSMLVLVVANSVFTFFMGWELVGLCSYLLISFWFEKPEAAYAGKKAFMTTKLGDLGFTAGLFLLFTAAGTLRISSLQVSVASHYISPEIATAVGLLFFMGAMGKSAQVPLLIWLPDAMEGPTPVSALIHAATMVAAGVYLVARLFFLYSIAPQALEVIAWFGLATAFFAATMALAAYDIKRVLAFSTVSQLGYMMLGLGVGDMTAGMFHLTTHAFFKALLFLGAGSVIHAVHTNDMREMGGLSSKMPITFTTMLIACLAIAGIPPLSGHYSKDAVLAAVMAHNPVMYYIAAFTAAMTAFYMFRLCFMTFMGNPRNHDKFTHAHESPAAMTVPLMILAVFAVFAGMVFEKTGVFERLVHFAASGGGEAAAEAVQSGAGHAAAAAGHAVNHMQIAVVSFVLAALSIAFSWHLYLNSPETAASLKKTFSVPFKILENRYYLDAVFLAGVALGDKLARAAYWFDYNVIDQSFVDGFGWATRFFSWTGELFDRYFIDLFLVDGTGYSARGFGAGLRAAQTGFVQNYLLYIALAASLFSLLVWSR